MNVKLLLVFLIFLSYSVQAVENVEVQGLFSTKAVVLIDGKRQVLATGKVSPEGVKVISINKNGAVLEINGLQKQYNLGQGSSISTTFTQRKKRQEKIFINSAGMYMTAGSINRRPVRFLVDTGASAIAMNTNQAKKLGIDYEKIGAPASVSTASGFAKAYRLQLKTVSVGDITQSNVEAFIIDGNHPGPILLGMTFLGRINVQHSGNAMTLTQED